MKQIASVIFVMLFLHLAGLAQNTGQGPHSSRRSFTSLYDSKVLANPDIQKFDAGALGRHQDQYKGSPLVSMPIGVNIAPSSSGEWFELENGDRVWLLHIQLRGAAGVGVFFRDGFLPRGAELRVFGADDRYFRDPITAEGLNGRPRFWSGVVSAESVIVEYYEPLRAKSKGDFLIDRIDYVYSTAGAERFGDALDCHVNVNCPEGDDWQQQKRSISRITMVLEEGIGFCTGNLMNNTEQDQTPYILTGFHCQDGFNPLYDLWFFDFNFEFDDCFSVTTPPDYLSLVGCVQRAGRQENDLLLLELQTAIPASLEPFFLGWDRTGNPPARSVNIHHPMADVKKITIIDTAAYVFNSAISWDNGVLTPPNHHFRLDYNGGTFETGSSGSAMIDLNGRMVAQLHGGLSGCESSFGYFARFSMSWDGGGAAENRLQDWLDPNGQGVMTLDGLDPMQEAGATVSGSVVMENDKAVSNVIVQLAGAEVAVIATAYTDANGDFSFGNVPLNSGYAVTIDKPDDAVDGLSVLDIIRIRKHVQNVELLDNPFQIIAADVDGSGSVNVLDIIKIQKVILNIDETFEDVHVWRYVPANFAFSDPANPFLDQFPETFSLNTLTGNFNGINVIGIKAGDVDSSVEP